MRAHHQLIYDSTNPYNLPAGVDCIAYYGGRFNWPEAAILRAHAVYRLNEVPTDHGFMAHCRGVGVEPGAHNVDQAIGACHARHQFGHDDFTVYTSLEAGDDRDYQPGMAGIIVALRAHAPGLPFRVHVADWGTSPDEVIEIDGVRDWAKQYLGNVHGGAYDLSVLHGVDDLVRV